MKIIDKYTMLDSDGGILLPLRSVMAHYLTAGYVISYPKSGRTWLRMLLATYFSDRYGVPLTPEITDQWRENRRIPTIRFVHLGTGEIDRRETDFDFSRYSRKKIVFLIRDPRDVCVSYYFHVNKRWKKVQSELQNISTFIRDNDVGLPRVVDFMNLVANNIDQISKVKIYMYEEIHSDAEKVLREVLTLFNERNIDENLVRIAVEKCQFAKMKRMEKEGEIQHDAMLPGNPDDNDSYKVREGKVGGYHKNLSDSDINYMNQYINDHLNARYNNYIKE